MLVREGQALNLKKVGFPQQPIYVNTHRVSSELGIQPSAQSPECVGMIGFDIKLFV